MNSKIYKKVVLVVLDGFGLAPEGRGNAISLAKTPNFDYLVSNYPAVSLQASGPLVGLPWGEMGNSEVGHLNMGAGRIAGQDLARINNNIRNGEFFSNPAFLKACTHVKNHHSALHIMGLLSPGGVHSLDEHFFALLALAKNRGIEKVFLHIFTDGRDTAQKQAFESIAKLDQKIAEIGIGQVASLSGRFYAMDRGAHFQQTALAFKAMVLGEGEKAMSPAACVSRNYSQGIFDEMIKPTVIVNETLKPVGLIQDNDAVIFANFRQDRAVQLTRAFLEPETFDAGLGLRKLQNLLFVCMTEYFPGLKAEVAFLPADFKNNLSEIISKNNLKQFHIAESEKYAHVTSFFNCGKSDRWPGEEWEIVASPENTRNYWDHPEMSLEKLSQVLVKK